MKPAITITTTTQISKLEDVDIVPSVSGYIRDNAYAVIIGIEKYRQKELPPVKFAVSDAKIIRDYLITIGGFKSENIKLLLNDEATKGDMENYLETWLANNVNSDSTVFVYFSGHGVPDAKTNNAYLLPYDGNINFIDKAYKLATLYEKLNNLPAKEAVVVLDSCFSGIGDKSVGATGAKAIYVRTTDLMANSKKITALTASSGDEISFVYNEGKHGLFTYFFLKGAKGEADKNKDDWVSLGELFDYVKDNVALIAKKNNGKQTVEIKGNTNIKFWKIK